MAPLRHQCGHTLGRFGCIGRAARGDVIMDQENDMDFQLARDITIITLALSGFGCASVPSPAGAATQVYFVKATAGNFISLQQFITLQLPAGTFLVTGKTYITSAAYGGCNLVSGPSGYETYYDGAGYESGAVQSAAVMIDKITLAAPTTVAIRCGNGLGATTYHRSTVLYALPVME